MKLGCYLVADLLQTKPLAASSIARYQHNLSRIMPALWTLQDAAERGEASSSRVPVIEMTELPSVGLEQKPTRLEDEVEDGIDGKTQHHVMHLPRRTKFSVTLDSGPEGEGLGCNSPEPHESISDFQAKDHQYFVFRLFPKEAARSVLYRAWQCQKAGANLATMLDVCKQAGFGVDTLAPLDHPILGPQLEAMDEANSKAVESLCTFHLVSSPLSSLQTEEAAGS